MSRDYFTLDENYGNILKFIGISTEEVLKKAKLPQDLLSRKTTLMNIDEYQRFMDAIKTISNDITIPLKIGTIENIETFSPPVFAAYCSKNSLTCMRRLSKYKSRNH